MLLNFIGINPIRALVISQVLNGILAIPLTFLILHVCNDRRIMGKFVNGSLANVLGYATLVLITTIGIAAIWSVTRGS